jgi:hypothetical protein
VRFDLPFLARVCSPATQAQEYWLKYFLERMCIDLDHVVTISRRFSVERCLS